MYQEIYEYCFDEKTTFHELAGHCGVNSLFRIFSTPMLFARHNPIFTNPFAPLLFLFSLDGPEFSPPLSRLSGGGCVIGNRSVFSDPFSGIRHWGGAPAAMSGKP